MTESIELYNDIASLLSGIGIELVELHLVGKHGSTKASAVVYKPSGTGIDECSAAHRLIQARLEVLLGNDDFQLETASPGIDRVIEHDLALISELAAQAGVEWLLFDAEAPTLDELPLYAPQLPEA